MNGTYGDGFTDWDKKLKYDGVLCAAAPRQYPQDLIDCLNINSKIVIPVGNSKSQQLHVITKLEGDNIKEDETTNTLSLITTSNLHRSTKLEMADCTKH